MPRKTTQKHAPSPSQALLPGMLPADLEQILPLFGSRYTILEKAGEGKTGVAYKLAATTNRDHFACLKTISPQVTDAPTRKRTAETIRKEVEILLSLRHRCLPEILEHHTSTEPPFYICTYHPGQPVTQFITGGHKLNAEDSIFLISCLIDVLEYLHSKGRTHCDLHGGNVLLSNNVLRDGLLVIDFGSGHRASDTTPNTPDRGLVYFKTAHDMGRYADPVPRTQEWEAFQRSDLVALGNLLAQLRPSVFADALPDQHDAYIGFCENLKRGNLGEWGQVSEEFRAVIDPHRLISGTRRLFSSSRGRLAIPLPVSRMVPVGDAVLAIINTTAFQRLRKLKQLSFCDWYFPGASHSRFEHSLGVFATTQVAINALGGDRVFRDAYNLDNVTGCLLASLVHDIGHYPFAHVVEQYTASRFPGDDEAKRIASHGQNTLATLDSDSELRTAIESGWGAAARPQAVRVLSGQIGLLSDLLDGPIDCDKLDYLRRDAWHSGVSYGEGLDLNLLLHALCSVEQGRHLGIRREGLPAAIGLMILQDQMLADVYWHECSRAVICMFHAVLAALIQTSKASLARIVEALKQATGEDSAIERVLIPEVKRLPKREFTEAERTQLLSLLEIHLRPRFTKIYRKIAEYRPDDEIPRNLPALDNIHRTIVSRASASATSVPINWANVRALREAYYSAFSEKGTMLGKFELVVDAPYGKNPHRHLLVRDPATGVESSIVQLSHLKPSIFEEPGAFLSPVRVFVSPAALTSIGHKLSSIVTSAEERYYTEPKQ